MTFPFSTTVPNAPNDPADDQPFMLTNNQSTSALIDRDHIGFNNVNGGFHRQVTFSTNQAAPGFGTGVSDLFANTVAGLSQPFWQNALGTYQLSGILSSTLATNGFVKLSNGLIIQWGVNTAPSSGSFSGGDARGTNSFPTAFTTAPFSVLSVAFYGSSIPNGSSSANIRNNGGFPSTTQFKWSFNSNSGDYTGFYWIAIGI